MWQGRETREKGLGSGCREEGLVCYSQGLTRLGGQLGGHFLVSPVAGNDRPAAGDFCSVFDFEIKNLEPAHQVRGRHLFPSSDIQGRSQDVCHRSKSPTTLVVHRSTR
jgi:hypothetical protein